MLYSHTHLSNSVLLPRHPELKIGDAEQVFNANAGVSRPIAAVVGPLPEALESRWRRPPLGHQGDRASPCGRGRPLAVPYSIGLRLVRGDCPPHSAGLLSGVNSIAPSPYSTSPCFTSPLECGVRVVYSSQSPGTGSSATPFSGRSRVGFGFSSLHHFSRRNLTPLRSSSRRGLHDPGRSFWTYPDAAAGPPLRRLMLGFHLY